MPNAYYWWQGGREGGSKIPKTCLRNTWMFPYQTLYWPFTVRINCSTDPKKFFSITRTFFSHRKLEKSGNKIPWKVQRKKNKNSMSWSLTLSNIFFHWNWYIITRDQFNPLQVSTLRCQFNKQIVPNKRVSRLDILSKFHVRGRK